MHDWEYCHITHIAGMPKHRSILAFLGNDKQGRHAIRSVELPDRRQGEDEDVRRRIELLCRSGWRFVDMSRASVQQVTSSRYTFKRPRA